MGQAVLHLTELLDGPLDAAARFHSRQVAVAREMLGGDVDALAIVFPPGGKPHEAWQLAAVQSLASEAAPKRVNGVVGDDVKAIDQTTNWLAKAPGITGQLLSVQTG